MLRYRKNLRCVVHGDDFTLLGHHLDLDWFRSKIKDKFEVKMRGRLGPCPQDDKSIRILNFVPLNAFRPHLKKTARGHKVDWHFRAGVHG